MQSDGFITKLHADGKSLVFSTFLGGTGTERVESVAMFPDGSLALVGQVTRMVVQAPFGPGLVRQPDPFGGAGHAVVVRDGQQMLTAYCRLSDST